MNRLDHLLLLWQEERISEAEDQELASLLASPEARRQLVDNFITTGIIRKVLAGESGALEEKEEEERSRNLPSGRVRKLARRGLALAAVFVLVIGLIRMLLPTPTEALRVNGFRGEVWVTDGAKQALLTEGVFELRAADSIQTGNEAFVILSYADGTQLRFSSHSKATLQPPKGRQSGKFVFLNRGTVTARVAKQPQGKPMIFDTAHARATVLGTELVLTAESESTRLEVTQGKVELARLSDGLSVHVSAGEFAIASAGGPLKALPIKRTAPGPGRILFHEAFEDGSFGDREWYDNISVPTAPGGAVPGSARAAEYHFLPDAKLAVSGGPIRRLFSETDAVYVSYWVKYSDSYVGGKAVGSAPEILLMTNADKKWDGPALSHLTAWINQKNGMPILSLQDGLNLDLSRLGQDLSGVTENRAVAGGNGVLPVEQASFVGWYPVPEGFHRNIKEFRVGEGYFGPGRPYHTNTWHHVEVYFKMNTISDGLGKPDGILKFWYDGKLLLDRNSVLMRTGQHPEMKFNQLLIAPYMEQGSSVDQTLWIDELTVAVEPPP